MDSQVKWMLEILESNGFTLGDLVEFADQLSSLKFSSSKNDKAPKSESEEDDDHLKMNRRITKILQEFRIPITLSGFQYLRDAIEMCYKVPEIQFTNSLYPDLAVNYCTTKSAIDRSIRHAIKRAELCTPPEIFLKYDCPQNPCTSKGFIWAIADYLRLND